MARYIARIRSPWPAAQAFTYMADLRNFAEWDPGVRSSTLVEGDAPGPGAVYDVSVSRTELQYETREFDPPRRTVVEAISPRFRSYDIIEVHGRDDGCEVVYDATLELRGVLSVLDPLLKLFFNRIGDKAADGMVRALEGERIG